MHRGLLLTLGMGAAACAVAAGAGEQSKPTAVGALVHGVTQLCSKDAKFNDAAALTPHGFRPGTAADEANLFLGGVKGEQAVAEIDRTTVRLNHFAPETCLIYVLGAGQLPTLRAAKDALIRDHGFVARASPHAGDDADDERLQRTLPDGRIQRIIVHADSAVAFPTVSMNITIGTK